MIVDLWGIVTTNTLDSTNSIIKVVTSGDIGKKALAIQQAQVEADGPNKGTMVALGLLVVVGIYLFKIKGKKS